MGTAHNGEIAIAYERMGAAAGAPLLLISGLGVQMLIWPDDLCAELTARGFQVVRFDNRDSGQSTHLTGIRAPGWFRSMLRPAGAPYRLEDMALDALAVMDDLGWESAHLVGASLGGMIAQTLAITHPSRVRTLTSIMSTPSARMATRPTLATIRAMIKIAGLPVTSPDEAAREAIAMKKAIGSPAYPIDVQLAGDIGRRSYERARPVAADDRRQRAAVTASGDRRKRLAAARVPALVLHGEQDPLIRPKGGQATAAAIPGARLVTYPGMGHDLPRALWPSFLDEICALAAHAEPGQVQPV